MARPSSCSNMDADSVHKNIDCSFLPSFTRGSQPEDSYCIESTPTKISQAFLTSFFTHMQYLCLLVQLYLISTLSLKSTVLPQLHQRECLPPNPAFLCVPECCHFFIPFPPLVRVLESKPQKNITVTNRSCIKVDKEVAYKTLQYWVMNPDFEVFYLGQNCLIWPNSYFSK